jgi:HrpA-like RNA helicase
MDESDESAAGPSSSPDRIGNGKRQKKTHGANGLAKVNLHLLEQRKRLPIWKGRSTLPLFMVVAFNIVPLSGKQSLISEIHSNDTVVILGETGCGKTTR